MVKSFKLEEMVFSPYGIITMQASNMSGSFSLLGQMSGCVPSIENRLHLMPIYFFRSENRTNLKWKFSNLIRVYLSSGMETPSLPISTYVSKSGL